MDKETPTDNADAERELANMADHELDELTAIYQSKGLKPELAREVAVQLTEHDAHRRFNGSESR